jgi:ATP-dependent RNA helicase DeaD
MRQPVTVEVDPERPTVDEIEQRFERVPDGDKLSALRAHLDDPSCFLALVFRRTTYKADRLARDLSRRGYKVAVLHGRRSQSQRERVLADLKAAKLQVLVATDIAARGLDIAGLTHVFNYDLPDTPETYVHRIGRTGRAGETGTAITFVAPEDELALKALERYLAGRREETKPKGSPREKPRTNRAPHQNRAGYRQSAQPTPNAGQPRSDSSSATISSRPGSSAPNPRRRTRHRRGPVRDAS